MATRLKVGSNRKETLDQLYNITGKKLYIYFFLLLKKEKKENYPISKNLIGFR